MQPLVPAATDSLGRQLPPEEEMEVLPPLPQLSEAGSPEAPPKPLTEVEAAREVPSPVPQ